MPDQININIDKPEEGDKLSKSEAKRASDIEHALSALASTLETKFQDYAGKREVKEKEWMAAERQYAGLLDEEDDKALRSLGGRTVTTTPPVVNITRQKTNIAIARMQDIQFPTTRD
jgi:hypothetical protein